MNQQEKRIVTSMIELYCRKNHNSDTLCNSCQKIQEYAMDRLEKCRFGEDKPTCQSCPIHCYKPEMKEEIKRIMRFSGPRMIFHHPIYALTHIYKQFFKSNKR